MLIALWSHLAMCRQFAVRAGDPPPPGVLMQLPQVRGTASDQSATGASRGFSDKLQAFSVRTLAEGLSLQSRQPPTQGEMLSRRVLQAARPLTRNSRPMLLSQMWQQLGSRQTRLSSSSSPSPTVRRSRHCRVPSRFPGSPSSLIALSASDVRTIR